MQEERHKNIKAGSGLDDITVLTPHTERTARDTAGVIAPPPLIFAATIGAGLLLERLWLLPFLPQYVGRVAGGLLLSAALLLAASAIITMRRAGTQINPGRPSTTLVTAGPYRATRNPIYLAFTLLTAGIAALTNSLWVLLLLLPALAITNEGVIKREEGYLTRRFGAAYTQYKARVRRWL